MQIQKPQFIDETVSNDRYVAWVAAQARRHYKRDNARYGRRSSPLEYRKQIHEAVIRSGGSDYYSGRKLDWHLIKRYRAGHKRSNYLNLPTVDHAFSGGSVIRFEICSWAVNDCKSDLPQEEWLDLMESIIKHTRNKCA